MPRFNVSVSHPECGADVTLQSGTLEFNYTDNAMSGWVPTGIALYNLTDDGTSATTWQGELDAVDNAYMGIDEYIDAGLTKTFGVWADTTGASSADDDSLRVDLPGMGVVWCVDDGTCSDASESGYVNGRTLVY